MGSFKEYDHYDGLGLAERVRRKEISPAELVEEAIRRIETVNPQINAIIHPMYDLARQQVQQGLPEGPFRGVPFLLKDLLVHHAGVPTRSGSRFFRDFIPDHDSEIVRRYRQAGVVVLGKTNTPELGLVPYTEPAPRAGPAEGRGRRWRRAWSPSPTATTAAAPSASRPPVAASSGSSPRAAAPPWAPTSARPGAGWPSTTSSPSPCGIAPRCWMPLPVQTSALRTLFIPPPERPFLEEVGRDPGRLRIAFTARPLLPGTVHPDCVRGVEETARLCQDLGHIVEEAAPQIDGHAFARDFLTMVCAETRADIEEGEPLTRRKPRYGEFEPATWALGLLGRQISAGEYARALRALQRAARQVGQFFESLSEKSW